MPMLREVLAEPAVLGVERGERDTGDGGRQRKRQIDQRIDDAPAGKVVAHERPGPSISPNHDVDRGRQRGTKA